MNDIIDNNDKYRPWHFLHCKYKHEYGLLTVRNYLNRLDNA